MRIDRGLLGRIRTRGEEVLTQLSAELSANPRLAKAVEGALQGRERLGHAAAAALEHVNLPTRSELKRATARIETLEREVAELRRQLRARGALGTKAGPRRGARAKPTGRRAPARGERTAG